MCLCSELKPELVKIDLQSRGDPRADKLQTSRALFHVAETFPTRPVAEDIETGDELRVLGDLGISYGQGVS